MRLTNTWLLFAKNGAAILGPVRESARHSATFSGQFVCRFVEQYNPWGIATIVYE
jgi:hypothetical protein